MIPPTVTGRTVKPIFRTSKTVYNQCTPPISQLNPHPARTEDQDAPHCGNDNHTLPDRQSNGSKIDGGQAGEDHNPLGKKRGRSIREI